MTTSRLVIAGAGPVGTLTGLLLAQFGLDAGRILLLDARDAQSAAADARLLALSEASRALLESAGAWPAHAATPIHKIHVSQRGAWGRTLIQKEDYGLAALGHVVRYGELVEALHAALGRAGISVERGARVVRTEPRGDSLGVVLASGETLDAAYLVHAEGGLYELQDPGSIHRDYGQTAITAQVTCALPQPGVAWERFTTDGPIALLPCDLEAAGGLALVWCCKPTDAVRRSTLDEAAFLDELHSTFGDRLGAFLSVGPRSTYALGLNARRDIARVREFAIGNAAQTLHPVAGQGLNLGLRDAYSLATLLVEHFDAPLTCQAKFKAARRIDRAATVNMTDLLPRVFASRLAPVAALRGAGLAFLDLVGPARHVLARQMMEGQR
jgi:2-octaprenyl-6-methoxyphenol hydroxylase